MKVLIRHAVPTDEDALWNDPSTKYAHVGLVLNGKRALLHCLLCPK